MTKLEERVKKAQKEKTVRQENAAQASTTNPEESDIRQWFASMDDRWIKAQALRAEELKAKARTGNPYEQDEDETEAEKEIREMISAGFFKLNGIIRRERNVEAALEFYFRFVLPDPHLAAPYLDLTEGDLFEALPRTTEPGNHKRLSGPLLRAVHESHTKGEQVERLGAAIREDFSTAVLAGEMDYACSLLAKIYDINDPDWHLMASCDPAFRMWILLSGPIGPHSLRPGNDVFRARSRGVAFWADTSRY